MRRYLGRYDGRRGFLAGFHTWPAAMAHAQKIAASNPLSEGWRYRVFRDRSSPTWWVGPYEVQS